MRPPPPLPDYDVDTSTQSASIFIPSQSLPIPDASSWSHAPSSSFWRHHPYSSSTSTSRSLRSRSRSTASASSAHSDRTYSEELSEASEDGQAMVDDTDYLPFVPTSAPTPSPLLSFPPLPSLPSPTKPKSSHARKTPPGHIKRPPNAFILFRSHCCSSTPSEDPNDPPAPSATQLAELGITDHRHISRITSHLWKSLPRAEKGHWERKALAKKAEHLRLYPEYKYKPVYRKKDEVRRRKKVVVEEEVDEEKRGCEEVARALLNPLWAAESERENEEEQKRIEEEERLGRETKDKAQIKRDGRANAVGKWTIATVAQALIDQDSSLPAPPPIRKRKTRARPQSPGSTKVSKNSKKKAATASKEIDSYASSSSVGSSSYCTTSQFNLDIPQSPTEEAFRPHTAPVGLSIPYASRRRTSYARGQPHSYESNPFSYNVLDDQSSDFFGHGPSPHDQLSASRPHTSSSTYDPPHSAPPLQTTRRGPPAPLDLSYNPTFAYYPSPVDANSSYTPTDPSQPVDPLAQIHSYALTPSTRPPAQAAHRSPTSPFFFDALPPAGMKRRGTLGRTTGGGGDLMLISPTADEFGQGRKFSMGKWEQDGGPLSAFEFDPDFLQSVMLGTQRIDGRSLGSWDPRGSISGAGGRRRSEVDPSWTGEAYHVGSTEYFATPDSALPLPSPRPFDARQPFPASTPSFGSVAFGNSFQPFNHRPSIDALLSSSVPHYSTHGQLAQPWASRTRGSDATVRGSVSGVARDARIVAAEREAKGLLRRRVGGR